MNVLTTNSKMLMEASPPMRVVYAAIIILLLSAGMHAQTLSPTVAASGGDYLANTSGSLSISIGQPAATTYQSTGNALTLGFQQPELLLHTEAVAPPLCLGATVNVPYSVSGCFSSINVFTAELSDASGSFAAPTVIGSLTCSTPGTIIATIPPGTAPGTGYRIRVVSSLPGFAGPDNGIDLTVNMPPSPAITVDPSPAVDPGGLPNTIYLGYGPQSVTLEATGGVSYSWYPTANLSNPNIANPVFSPTAEGMYTYTVTVVDGNGCSNTADVSVNVIDVVTGNKGKMVTICINGQTIAVQSKAVASMLQNSGATLGPCMPKIAAEPQHQPTPTGIVLHQNYPNPFNPTTVIGYSVQEDCVITLHVFDVYGRKVSTLVNELVTAGSHSVVFNAGDLPSGVYTYVLESGNTVLKRRMVLIE